jgi:hypothetical protein
MANMNKRIHDIVYPKLADTFGETCRGCNKDKFALVVLGMKPELMIDHIDNNNGNNSLHNLQLLCRSCNTKKNWSRNNNIEPNLRNAPLELQISKTNKTKVFNYIIGELEKPENNNRLYYDELLDDLSCFLGNSQQANKNYLKAMCSKRHGLFTLEDMNGDLYLVPKNDDELGDTII